MINEPDSFNGSIEELLASCYYFIGRNEDALRCIEACLELHPDRQKLLDNKQFLEEVIKGGDDVNKVTYYS